MNFTKVVVIKSRKTANRRSGPKLLNTQPEILRLCPDGRLDGGRFLGQDGRDPLQRQAGICLVDLFPQLYPEPV